MKSGRKTPELVPSNRHHFCISRDVWNCLFVAAGRGSREFQEDLGPDRRFACSPIECPTPLARDTRSRRRRPSLLALLARRRLRFHTSIVLFFCLACLSCFCVWLF